MNFIETDIPDVKIIEPQVFGDERGFFMETFRTELFNLHCGERTFVQENHSKSAHGILRGLHYQTQNTQGKLVRVTQGEVFDVAVDMRKDSPTFGRWVGVLLSAENKRQLWVPEGFAHGFQTLVDYVELLYFHDHSHCPQSEVIINPNDPSVGVEWPLRPSKIAEKDLCQEFL